MMTTVSAVSSVGEKLSNLLVHDEVVHQLRSDLGLIENYLVSNQSDAGNNNNNNNNISGDVLKQVRQLAYEIEDAVESYAAGEQATTAAASKGAVFRCLLKPSTTRSREEDLSALKMRIDEVKNILTIRSTSRGGGGGSTPPAEAEHHQRRAPDYRASSIVPLTDQVSQLRNYLFHLQLRQLSITAIVGMPGLGKTTLAGLCYNDPLVTEYFDIRAWATLGREFQARDILETILFSLASSALSRDEIAGMETMELINQLHKAQKGRKYLIVLDDIWSLEDWNTLRFAFRDEKNGSRILITARAREFEKIADFVYLARFMTAKEGFEFLRLRSGGLLDDDPDMQVNPELEEIAYEVAIACDGLPIVIAVVGGAMRTKKLEEWKRMEQILTDMRYSIKDVEDILTLGYNQFPLHLKPCFLYLGYFPHNQPIPVEKLCLLWIAEGLISIRGSNNDKSQMEVAEEYFDELFDRSMVIVVVNEEVPVSARFQSCKLNDSLRDICIQKGEEEKFFKVSTDENRIRNITGRVVALCLNTNDVPLNISEGKDIRSFLFYDRDESHSKQTRPREVPNLTEFHRTRVLDFDGVDFRVKKLPIGIEKLIYLRHLSFRGCYLHEFTSSLSNFPFLETLDLRVGVSCTMIIHNVLRKLSSLKHLYFPLAFRCVDTKDKLKLDTLTQLQVLENFDACLCDVDGLLQLENLRILTVSVDGNNMDLKKTTRCLNKNKFLRHSSLVVKNFDSYTKERLSIVAALLECSALRGLNIEGYLGVKLLHEDIGSNFTSMVFNGSEFNEDPMPILGKLRNLRSLVLCNDAFVATKMVCSETDFPQLTSLELATLQSLEKWEVQGDAFMPRLAILTIEKCEKLEDIPSGLSEISTLRKIIVRSMPKEFQDKVKETTNKLRVSYSYEY